LTAAALSIAVWLWSAAAYSTKSGLMKHLHGVHIVSACNNDDFSSQSGPATFSVITVNMARVLTTIGLLQTGESCRVCGTRRRCRSPVESGAIKQMTGSSFATPVFSGLLARLLSSSRSSVLWRRNPLTSRSYPWTANCTPNVSS
jgi:hypothetical protein